MKLGPFILGLSQSAVVCFISYLMPRSLGHGNSPRQVPETQYSPESSHLTPSMDQSTLPPPGLPTPGDVHAQSQPSL